MKTLTSKKVFSCLPSHALLADMSSLAPSCEFAVVPDIWLGDTGCSSGSMRTSLHTSVSKWAVKSQISLCLIVGKPPLAQESACSTVKLLPHSHFRGCLDGFQPYHGTSASWKADVCKEKSWSLRGRTVSQVEAPFSLEKSIALCSWSGWRL